MRCEMQDARCQRCGVGERPCSSLARRRETCAPSRRRLRFVWFLTQQGRFRASRQPESKVWMLYTGAPGTSFAHDVTKARYFWAGDVFDPHVGNVHSITRSRSTHIPLHPQPQPHAMSTSSSPAPPPPPHKSHPSLTLHAHRSPHKWFTPTHLYFEGGAVPTGGKGKGKAKGKGATWQSRRARRARYAAKPHSIHDAPDDAARGPSGPGIGREVGRTVYLRMQSLEEELKPHLMVDISFWVAVAFTFGSAVWVVNGEPRSIRRDPSRPEGLPEDFRRRSC